MLHNLVGRRMGPLITTAFLFSSIPFFALESILMPFMMMWSKKKKQNLLNDIQITVKARVALPQKESLEQVRHEIANLICNNFVPVIS
jgi:hypothetical protein